MKLIKANRKAKCLTFISGYSKMIICCGREVLKIGFFTPVEYRKAYKMYHAIVNEA